MKEVFVYKDKVSYTNLYPAAAGFILAGVCWYFQYGISFKNLRLLDYPNSAYLLLALGILFLVLGIRDINKSKQSVKNPNPIIVEDNGLSFPHKGNKVEVAFSEIEKIYNETDEDDGDSLVIRTQKGKKHAFFADNFEDKTKFASFAELISSGIGQK